MVRLAIFCKFYQTIYEPHNNSVIVSAPMDTPIPKLVRIVVLDYYMSPPLPGLDVVYSEFRGASVNQVPVLRCFGSSEDGKKICVHIHGVFPYLYIPFDGKDNPDQLMYQIATALDRAINISFNQASSNTQHVYKISLVSGIPMYGYHPKKHLFFKIQLYNPMLTSKVGALLINKNILDRVFQPHESHLNFTLQFMIDYNLHGMSNMLISDILYRINPECTTSEIEPSKFLPRNIEKITVCELEADINAENILNRQEILSGNLAVNPGIAALWEDEKQRRRNKNEESQLGNFLSLKHMKVDPTKTHLIFQQALKERLAVLSTDKDLIPKLSPNASVYPAETPTDSTIQNASVIDIHSSSSLELSLDDTLNITCSQLNATLTPNDNNVTLDEVAQEFIRMLQAMADESLMDQGDESILSQKVPEVQNDDSTEDLLDLSMPLAALTTPIKVNSEGTEQENSDEDDIDYLNTTLIPQLDGQVDSLDSVNECIQKLPKNRSMPLLDTSDVDDPLPKQKSEYYVELKKGKLKLPQLLVNIEPLNTEEILRKAPKAQKTRTWNRRSPEEKLNETLRLMRYRINKLNRKKKVKRIGKILRKNDYRATGLLRKCVKPKFRALPAKKWFLESQLHPEGIDNTTVSHLINLTQNYTYPELKALLTTPSKSYFLYCDGGPMLKFVSIKKNNKKRYKYYKSLVESSQMNHSKQEKLTILQNQILNIKPKPIKKSQRIDKIVVSSCDNNNNKQDELQNICDNNNNKQAELQNNCDNNNNKQDELENSCDNNNNTQDELQNKIKSSLQSHVNLSPINEEINIGDAKYKRFKSHKNDCDIEVASIMTVFEPEVESITGKSNDSSYTSLVTEDPSTKLVVDDDPIRNCNFFLKPKFSNCSTEIDNLAEKFSVLKITDNSKEKRLKNVKKFRLYPDNLDIIADEHDAGVSCPSRRISIDKTGKRKYHPSMPYLYLNCDGAMDSSTDEEKPPKISPKKRILRKRVRSYAPLELTVINSPRIQGNYQGGPSENTIQISGKNQECQENPLQIIEAPAITPLPYKRKLFTENESILNYTTLEEFKACSYSPKPNVNEKTPKDAAEINESFESNNSQSYNNSSSSDSDLFPEKQDLDRSFFRSYNLTISEKYDSENKYKAKEGCSTVFTPNSFPNSMSSLKNQAMSGNSSSDITPYQEKPVDSQQRQQVGNIFKPSLKAPTKEQVETSLSKYKIPCLKQQEPFYSNVNDYTGTVEIGHRIMRVASKTTAHLLEFNSEFDGLNKHRQFFIENVANLKYNSNNVKSLKLAHCSSKNVILCPLKKPPLLKEVVDWVTANSKKDFDEEIISLPETKTTKSIVYIPNSPDGGNDSESDLSLTLTPYSASDNESLSVTATDHRKTKCKKKPLRDSVLPSQEVNKSCQISGMSHHNSYGFDISVQNLQAARAVRQYQFLTTMVMELHIRTRGDLKPDPQIDNICAIFYSIYSDVPESDLKKSRTRGVIAVNLLPADLGASRQDFLNGVSERDCDITYVDNEEALINNFLILIKYWDPDIFAGYEIEMLSWGYLMERASVLSINILPLLGRSQLHKYGKMKLNINRPDMDTNIIGRIVLAVWRIMRHEIALQSYTFESIVYHILHRRVPMYPFKDLTFWWDHKTNLYRHRVIRYYLQRADTVLELFDKLDFLNRTSELAKLFGILFYEVLSRGSQFRVESMMLRLAKPLNYVPVSPDVQQRAHMKAPEYIALIMEPESKLYTDPVIVLDFQSLYPSIIIAYNYCFTTCLGRVSNLGTNHPFEFGATQLKISKKIVEKLCKKDLINFSPCGVAFVKQRLREGILPRMLKEVLDTRLMVKNSMKENKGDANLQKVLHNRQLGLKLIANVTYGYTAANFSGRMCCVEVGDSVVSKGRETLQRAIAMVESTPEWEAKVVYGDTDSMFVLVPGKTRAEAFEIGKKIADAVTADNPDPIKLKLEKVYQPCILQTKKRYVGYMYEGPNQKEPVYEAKGIETVRRDGCPAVSKMLQKCLTLLFETKNVSLIKNYLIKQFYKIQTGRASIQDLTFAKEFRGASGYKPGACVPALELARKWTAVDKRNEPRSGERVPYIIVNGPPGLPLIRLVKSPRDLLNDNSLRPNALYYITKVIIPPINRCLNLIGADLNLWFNQMPRKYTQYLPNSSPIIKSTIAQYFATKICASCTEPTQDGICAKCCKRPNVTALILIEKLKKWEKNYHSTLLICQSCTNCLEEISCVSLDCPVLYRRTQTFNDLQQSTYVRELLSSNNIFSEDFYY